VDMSASNAWAEYTGVYRRTRTAFLKHERAKIELKALAPEDAREATGRDRTDGVAHLDPFCDPPELYQAALELLTGIWGQLDAFSIGLQGRPVSVGADRAPRAPVDSRGRRAGGPARKPDASMSPGARNPRAPFNRRPPMHRSSEAISHIAGALASEFTVPLCRTHHQDLHRHGNEKAWWRTCRSRPCLLVNNCGRLARPAAKKRPRCSLTPRAHQRSRGSQHDAPSIAFFTPRKPIPR